MQPHRCAKMLVAIALVFATAAASAQTPSGPDVVEAIWRVQQFDFAHSSARNFYDCDELRARLVRMLRTLGADESVTVEMQCAQSRVSRVRARISVAVPVEATEANIRAATRFDARDSLVARLRGFTLPTAADVERFPAAWRRVALTQSGRRRFDDGECELLSDVQQQILPRLSVRGGATLYCPPWATRVSRTFEVEALVRMSAPARSPQAPLVARPSVL